MRNGFYLLVVTALLFAIPRSAAAYIGPGAGLSAIGTVIALFGAILFAIVGFVWYPIKRFRARHKTDIRTEASAEREANSE